jgi:predicted DCC family thiol-disulfide oxidoreductase YuxK
VLARDPDGSRFRFTSLGSPAAKRILGASAAEDLPDSLILQLSDGRLLFRSEAVVAILERLGSFWPVVAGILRRCPRGLRDGLYDRIATLRSRFFEKPTHACPVVDPALRDRFDDGLDATYASE